MRTVDLHTVLSRVYGEVSAVPRRCCIAIGTQHFSKHVGMPFGARHLVSYRHSNPPLTGRSLSLT